MVQTLDDLLPTLAMLAAHRTERHSLAELARQAGTSASTFQRAFARIVGESAKQYTRRLQLETSVLDLISSDRSVLEVALDAGFESHEGFTRAFSSHFGLPPREFRRRYAHLGSSPQHRDLIDHIGPCVGLFRASLGAGHFEDPTMNYDIARQQIEDCTFLYMKGRCTHAEIANTLAGLLGGVYQHAMENGIELCSPPTALYAEWGPGMVTLHAGMMVASASPSGDIHVEALPAGEAAVTIHTGSYDGLGDAHAAVEQYLAEHDLQKAGPPREIYLTDPGEVPDPKDWKTQVVWPIA